jgi:hypothetical protein
MGEIKIHIEIGDNLTDIIRQANKSDIYSTAENMLDGIAKIVEASLKNK